MVLEAIPIVGKHGGMCACAEVNNSLSLQEGISKLWGESLILYSSFTKHFDPERS